MRAIMVSYAKLPRPIANSYQTVTVSNSVIPFPAASLPAAASMALVNIDTNPIKYTIDGSTPSATNGHLVAAGGQFLLLSREEITAFRVIRQGGADAAMCVTFFSGA